MAVSIGVAAARIGRSADTLRRWERAGVIRPARVGSMRVYSERDIARLRKVASATLRAPVIDK